MSHAISQILQNPYLPGHSLTLPTCAILKPIREAIDRFQECSEIPGHLPPEVELMTQGPVKLGLDEVLKLQIRGTDGKSERSDLKGVTFKTDYSYENKKFTYLVSLVENPLLLKSKKCERLTSALVLMTLGAITAPVTLPAFAVGTSVKAYSHFCSKRSLHVEEVALSDYPQMADLAEKWQELASDKKRLDRENPIFRDSYTISKLVKQCFKSGPNRVFTRAYACKDNWGLTQGFLLLRDDCYESKIAHIITHPHNIRSPLNADVIERIERVGTTLVDFAAQRCLDLKKRGLYLEGTESSKPFYVKYGFDLLEEAPYMIEDGDYAMELSAAKIREKLHPRSKVA